MNKISHTVLYIKIKKHTAIEKYVLCRVFTCQSCIANILLICRERLEKGVVSIMKFEMHTKIISNEKEVRLHIEENIFQLKLDGYHLFTVQEILPLYKSNEERIGSAMIQKLEWENGKTTINYQLVSLKSVN